MKIRWFLVKFIFFFSSIYPAADCDPASVVSSVVRSFRPPDACQENDNIQPIGRCNPVGQFGDLLVRLLDSRYLQRINAKHDTRIR